MLLASLFLVPAILGGPGADAPPPSAEAVEALLARMQSPAASERLAAGREMAALPVSGFDLYVGRLLRTRTTPPATLRAIVLETWAQVPNPTYPAKGEMYLRKPEPPWRPPPVDKTRKGPRPPPPRRPPPHDPEKVEWLGALAELDLDGNPALRDLPEKVLARAEAIEAVALMRAIAASQRLDAVNPIFEFAFRVDGVFRDECGRTLRTLGALAVPSLVVHQRTPGPKLGRQRRYASYQLDRLDRSRPSVAVAAAPDDRVRAAILHAYGETRALDAVEAVLGQIDAASRQVRREARWAWLRYVSGPAPPPSPRRKRKLAGGGTESEEKEDYLDYREMATLAVRRQLEAALDEPVAAEKSAEEMTRELFAWHDRRRSGEFDALFRHAGERRTAGDLAAAVADYSAILARDPFHARRGEMADAFLDLGEKLRVAGDPRAAASLRQGVALAPDGPRVPRVEAELALLDAAQARGDGVEAALRRALALDPTLEEPRRRLDEMARQRARRRLVDRVGAVGGGVAVVALLLLAASLAGWVGSVLRRRRR